LPGLINNIDIAIFAEEVAPGRAGQAGNLRKATGIYKEQAVRSIKYQFTDDR